jgi:proteic killer suppression protein
MIQNFSCKETEKIWQGQFSRRFPEALQQRALNKLEMLDVSASLNDLRLPSSNHLEALKGNRQGWHSIRINRQWRICFKWERNHAKNVVIEDYH